MIIIEVTSTCAARLDGQADGLRCTQAEGHSNGHTFEASAVPQQQDTEAQGEGPY